MERLRPSLPHPRALQPRCPASEPRAPAWAMWHAGQRASATPIADVEGGSNGAHSPCTCQAHAGLDFPSPGLSLRGKKKRVRNAKRNDRSRGRSLLPGHGAIFTSKIGGWWLAVGGGWRLAADGGWRRLAVGVPWGLSLRAVL